MKKVGIYSGTFDPVHEGHLAFARAAIKECDLDKVFFLIEPSPRRKQGVKAFEHRIRMVQLAIQRESKFGSIMLEQQRFTVDDTLPALIKRFEGAELYLLLGDDASGRLSSWPHVEDLVTSVRFVIASRRRTQGEVKQQISVLERTRGFKIQYRLIQAPRPDISSSTIKRALKRGSAKGLPGNVSEYIETQGLYTAK